jgi:hypothetical protein
VSELCGALEACAEEHQVPAVYASRAACVDEKLEPFSLPLVTDACRTAGERLHSCLLRESRCQFFPSERVCDEDYCEDTDPYATLVHEKTQCEREWEAYGTECPVIG